MCFVFIYDLFMSWGYYGEGLGDGCIRGESHHELREKEREKNYKDDCGGRESYPARLLVSLQDLQDTPSFTARCFGTLN